MGARIAEVNQNAVAHELGDEAVVAADRLGAPGLKRGDHIAQVFGVHRLGKRGHPTRSQNITVNWRRSASACTGVAAGAGTGAGGAGVGAEERGGWAPIAGKELPAMADRGNTHADQVLGCQVWQDVPVDIVVAERRLVLLKTELPKPTRDIDRHPGHPLFNAPASTTRRFCPVVNAVGTQESHRLMQALALRARSRLLAVIVDSVPKRSLRV